jgi:ribosomal protein L3 glutamine methyltransferase
MATPKPGASLREIADWVEGELAQAPLVYGHGTDNPRDEAVWLLLAALGRCPVTADVDPDEPVDTDGIAAVADLLGRRVEGRRPLAYLTGIAWFAGLSFCIDERALVPRSPLAEPIVERFEPWIGQRPVGHILDLGTGCGCIAVACAYAFPEALVDASDVDGEALTLARENVARHGLDGRVSTYHADLFDGLPVGHRYDLIVSNPPYVGARAMAALPTEYRHEPSQGLDGGADGLALIERLIRAAGERLTACGLLVVETGAAGEALERRWPHLAPAWLEFDHGGDGVLLIGRDQLLRAGLGDDDGERRRRR